MTFIIALGVIIILLCSASVLKLMQPKEDDAAAKNLKARSNRRKKTKPKIAPKVSKPVAPTLKKSKPAPAKKTAESRPPAQVADVISIALLASTKKPYAGYELLQSLLSCGLRFGNDGIFHRHEKKTGVGSILFSLAACTKEGTFDLANIGAFESHGLMLFMKPGDSDDPVMVFETMLETADQLVTDLGGKVLNDKQQLLKKDDVLAIHHELAQFMKERHTMDLLE